MKINGPQSPQQPVSLDQVRQQKTEKAKQTEQTSSPKDNVDTKLSKALSDVVTAIESFGISAGEVHSQIEPAQVAVLLSEAKPSVARPKMSDEYLLSLTDRTNAALQESPESAQNLFVDLRPSRVLELLEA